MLSGCTTWTRTGPGGLGLTRMRLTFPGGATTSTSCSGSTLSGTVTRLSPLPLPMEESLATKDGKSFFGLTDARTGASRGSSLSSSPPRRTVIFLSGLLRLAPNSLDTSGAFFSVMSSPSTAMILSPTSIFPTITPSSCTLKTFGGPGGLGLMRMRPIFPAGAEKSSCCSESVELSDVEGEGTRPEGESSSSSSTSLSTVIFLLAWVLLLARSLLTLIAVIALTSWPSTATILSPIIAFPFSGLSSRMLNTYAGPGSAGGSGVTRTMPSFPEGHTRSSLRSFLGAKTAVETSMTSSLL
mmetsp:Transcript_58594/g.124346  ORF Transcript_58594/g.124346 Transcript_58594/m.124346 type:complete len:298 (+) Transcript_58594:2004-2897(+)